MPSGRRLTRVEQARIEALKSFGGAGLHDVLGNAKRKVANTLEGKKGKEATEEEDSVEKENSNNNMNTDATVYLE